MSSFDCYKEYSKNISYKKYTDNAFKEMKRHLEFASTLLGSDWKSEMEKLSDKLLQKNVDLPLSLWSGSDVKVKGHELIRSLKSKLKENYSGYNDYSFERLDFANYADGISSCLNLTVDMFKNIDFDLYLIKDIYGEEEDDIEEKFLLLNTPGIIFVFHFNEKLISNAGVFRENDIFSIASLLSIDFDS